MLERTQDVLLKKARVYTPEELDALLIERKTLVFDKKQQEAQLKAQLKRGSSLELEQKINKFKSEGATLQIIQAFTANIIMKTTGDLFHIGSNRVWKARGE